MVAFFVLIIIFSLLLYWTYKLEGKECVLGLGFISFICLGVSIIIIKIFDFYDGSLGTILTSYICFLLPPIISNLIFTKDHLKERNAEKVKEQIRKLDEEIDILQKKIKSKKQIINLLNLIRTCNQDISYIENSDPINDSVLIRKKIAAKEKLRQDLINKL